MLFCKNTTAKEVALSLALNVLGKLPRNIQERLLYNMRIPDISNSPEKIQLARLGHVYFEHPDLDEFSEFAKDFGFVLATKEDGRVYFRGYGKDPFIYVASQSTDGRPHFRGPAFVANSQEEFEKAKVLSGGQLSSLDKAPGGGEIITFNRADDTQFHIVFGQEERQIDVKAVPSATHQELGPFNTPFEKPRKGTTPRSCSCCIYHMADDLLAQASSRGSLMVLL